MPLYRGVRGELPHGFWMPDTAGMVCGVEMGFMSTSRQKHTPMNYMAKTGMNVLWALKPMCETDEAYHRGADVAILSQFESEAEGAPRPAPKSLARFLRALQTPYWRVFCAQSCSRRARCWLYGSTRAQCPSLADREARREVKAHYVQARMRGPPESRGCLRQTRRTSTSEPEVDNPPRDSRSPPPSPTLSRGWSLLFGRAKVRSRLTS